MTETIHGTLPKENDHAEILIGCDWHQCQVVSIAEIPHWSGNVELCYCVVFPDGQSMHCGRNSIRRMTPQGTPNDDAE